MKSRIDWSHFATGKPVRVSLVILGAGLLVAYGMMLIVVSIDLPDSWVGLVYATIGLTGSVSCIRYYFTQCKALLIPIFAASLLLAIFALGILVFGERVDERLQHREQNPPSANKQGSK